MPADMYNAGMDWLALLEDWLLPIAATLGITAVVLLTFRHETPEREQHDRRDAQGSGYGQHGGRAAHALAFRAGICPLPSVPQITPFADSASMSAPP